MAEPAHRNAVIIIIILMQYAATSLLENSDFSCGSLVFNS
jgi:hypothetical protein